MDDFRKLLREQIPKHWMYDWISELRNQEDWWKSKEHNDLSSDLSSIFSFRDSKIHLLKKIREKLMQIQRAMVILSFCLRLFALI
jgi:hypothetical protein